MELASATGSGRKITEFTMAKSAALAAMHTANVSSTVSANPLSRHSDRTPYFRSCQSASIGLLSPHAAILVVNGRSKLYRSGGLAPANQYAYPKPKVPVEGQYTNALFVRLK